MSTAEEESAPPSKTQRKRAMEELQVLGEDLVALPADRVRKIELPEDLRAKELAPQLRLPITTLVAKDRWSADNEITWKQYRDSVQARPS